METKHNQVRYKIVISVIAFFFITIGGILIVQPPKPQAAFDTYLQVILGKEPTKNLNKTFNVQTLPVANTYKNILHKEITNSIADNFDISTEQINKEYGSQVALISQAMLNKLKSDDIKYKVTNIQHVANNRYTADIKINGMAAAAVTDSMQRQLIANVLDNLGALTDKHELLTVALKSMPKAIKEAQTTNMDKHVKVTITRRWYERKWSLVDAKSVTTEILNNALSQEQN